MLMLSLKTVNPQLLIKKTGNPIQTSRELTQEDIRQVNLMYKCAEKEKGCTRSQLPKITGDGNIKERQVNFKLGDKVTLECGEGSKASGPSTATCENGGFTPPTFTCKQEPTSTCSDNYGTCTSWSASGFCNVNAYKNFMHTNCKKSCDLCPVEPKVACVNKNDLCENWSQRGFCVGRFEAYMSRNCQKSCKTCGQCDDVSRYCEAYNNLGYCTQERYSESMNYLCPKTCELC